MDPDPKHWYKCETNRPVGCLAVVPVGVQLEGGPGCEENHVGGEEGGGGVQGLHHHDLQARRQLPVIIQLKKKMSVTSCRTCLGWRQEPSGQSHDKDQALLNDVLF